MIKTYKCPKYNEAVMYFWTVGGQKKVVFKNGYVFDKRPSTFTTSDPALQCAMEADKRFGADYTIMTATKEEIDIKMDEIKKAGASKKAKEQSK